MNNIIDVKAMADGILDKVAHLPNKKKLAIITVGNDKASQAYVRGKKRDCERVGIEYYHSQLDASTDSHVVKNLIDVFNHDDTVGGIILQLPTPYEAWEERTLLDAIYRNKDVDGFLQDSCFKPCTPEGILYVLYSKYTRGLDGLNVLLIGRGALVGTPLIPLLLAENVTLTVAHSYTPKRRLDELLRANYDVVITATNRAMHINLAECNARMVIDAGIGYWNGILAGNCYGGDYFFGKYTPVPGGVGLMTRAILMAHIARASDPTFKY